MSNKINISIPKPCHENWEAMTPEDKGRFCSVCTKTVFDFTKASDKEIIEQLNKDKKTCGRFYNNQLNRDLIVPKQKSSYWLVTTVSLLGFLGIGNHTAHSQVKQDTIQTDNRTDFEIKNNQTIYKKIKGNVFDEVGEIAGACVTIKGTNKKTTTDMEGNFEIDVKNNDILEITYAGKITEKLIITNKNKFFIKLHDAKVEEFDVIIGGYKTNSLLEIQLEKIMNWFR